MIHISVTRFSKPQEMVLSKNAAHGYAYHHSHEKAKSLSSPRSSAAI
jgi:hypothetical protein